MFDLTAYNMTPISLSKPLLMPDYGDDRVYLFVFRLIAPPKAVTYAP